jgi:peptidyl-tRNA hydrolase, PTH1 family
VKKFLVAGLGNIGDEYAHTRHNIGFDIVDVLALSFLKEEEKKNKIFSDSRLAMVAHVKFKGRQVTIIKPTTYMNLSGKAVNYWMAQEKVEIENLLIVADDIALPFGRIRIKKKGSDGGHNGLTSIIETLGTEEFPRLRFGIGGDFTRGKQVDYVLGKWSIEEGKVLPEKITTTVEAIKTFITMGVEKAMTSYNKK